MSRNGIELRTLPVSIDKQLSSQKAKSVDSKGREDRPKPRKGKAGKDVRSYEATGPVSHVNGKKGANIDENMNTSKKSEKKIGLREWFMGKTAKNPKSKLSNTARTDSKSTGPIVERLQKQNEYLSATILQNQKDKAAKNDLSPDHEHLNYDEFIHKRHLFQNHARPTFCDVCDDFILGIYKSAIRCKCK